MTVPQAAPAQISALAPAPTPAPAPGLAPATQPRHSCRNSQNETINWDIKTPYPGRGKVPIPKWMTFLTEDVGIELTDMVNVVQHTITGTLLIEMVSKEKFETFLRKAEQ